MKKSIKLALSIATALGFSSAYGSAIYCVQDNGLNDSQFCKSDHLDDATPTPAINPLGPEYKDCDIEALDIMHDPGLLYAASGDNTPRPGHLYRVDMSGAGLYDLGDVDAPGHELTEIDGISFHPVDGDLYGWAQDEGLFVIPSANVPLDPGTYLVPGGTGAAGCNDTASQNSTVIKAEMVIPTEGEIEDIEWNWGGTKLYAVENLHSHTDPDRHGPPDFDEKGIKLWVYTPPSSGGPSITSVCDDLVPSIVKLMGDAYEIEGIESFPRTLLNIQSLDDLLILSFHKHKGGATTDLKYVTIVAGDECNLVDQATITADFNDIEGVGVGPDYAPFGALVEGEVEGGTPPVVDEEWVNFFLPEIQRENEEYHYGNK